MYASYVSHIRESVSRGVLGELCDLAYRAIVIIRNKDILFPNNITCP